MIFGGYQVCGDFSKLALKNRIEQSPKCIINVSFKYDKILTHAPGTVVNLDYYDPLNMFWVILSQG